jgi:predicted ribosome quality control (RQC) complex YloA/Tae2 family protein
MSTQSAVAVQFDLKPSDTYASAVNALTAYALALELDSLLKGRTVESAVRFAGGMTIVFSGKGRRFLHLVSAGRESEIIISEARLLPEDISKPAFGDLNGTEVTEVEPLGLDRVILINFNEKKSWGESSKLTLRIDLSPVFRSAALFREGTGHALETFGAPGSRPPGSPDQLPPPRRWTLLGLPDGWKLEFAPDDEEETGLSSFLTGNVGGVDPVLAGALTERHADDHEGLAAALIAIGKQLSTQTFDWKTYDFPGSGDRGTCAVYPVGIDFDPRPGSPDSLTAVLDTRTEEKVIPVFTTWLKKAASKHHRRALKKARRLLKNVEEDLESARRAEEFRYLGNLLVTWRHRLRTGLSEITTMDFNGEDEITIPLDPALDPERNIQVYFRRAKKGEKGIEIIKARRKSIREDIADLEKSIAKTDAIDDPAGLAAIIIPEGTAVTRSGKVKDKDKPRFKAFPVDDTHTIYVGKSDKENDELTHRFAKPTDLWFHTQGTPGSHVVLKGANRSTPARVIEMAAEIAAWFSKARGSGTVPVICAEKRYVRRPRGAKLGTASCIRSKTLFVSPRLPDDDS